MTNKGHITAVSLGPGDPDLITVKGLNVLKKADKVYFPGSLFSNGRKSSYSQDILAHYNLDEAKCFGFYLEMSLDRAQANTVYDETFHLIQQDWNEGLKIAVVSEGDASTYSSFSYLLERFDQAEMSVDLIPGITSYNLGAAVSRTILGLQNEKMTILPRVQSTEELKEAMQFSKTVILMKIRTVMGNIESVINEMKCSFVYCERLGTEKEFITSDWEEVKKRSIPYFSLIIVQK